MTDDTKNIADDQQPGQSRPDFAKQCSLDLVTDDTEKEKSSVAVIILETEDDYLKVKEKPPPGINASLVLLYAVFFSMFATGWVNLNSCSLNRLIPIYLIVAGFVGSLAKFLSKLGPRIFFNIALVLVFFDVVWHCLGTWWVYKEYQPNYDPKLGLYCNRTAYLLAFWILTLQYTLLLFFVLLSACYMLMRGSFYKLET